MLSTLPPQMKSSIYHTTGHGPRRATRRARAVARAGEVPQLSPAAATSRRLLPPSAAFCRCRPPTAAAAGCHRYLPPLPTPPARRRVGSVRKGGVRGPAAGRATERGLIGILASPSKLNPPAAPSPSSLPLRLPRRRYRRCHFAHNHRSSFSSRPCASSGLNKAHEVL